MRCLGPVVACIVVAGCGRGGQEEGESPRRATRVDEEGRVVLSPQERAAVGLETVVAREGMLTTHTLRFGMVAARPEEDTPVVSPAAARIRTLAVALGDRVAEGDPLLTLEPLLGTASVASLEAQRRELLGQSRAAVAKVEAKQSDLARVQTLFANGLATEADRERAEAELFAEQARAESSRRASRELGRATGAPLEIRAPAPGIVASLGSSAGSIVEQGVVLVRLVRPGPRWIDVAVPPGDPVGDGYRVDGIAGPVRATLTSRGRVVQEDGMRRDRLVAAPELAEGLPPGATVPVSVLHETSGLVVPASALIRRGRRTIVFVERGEGRYMPTAVEVGARDDAKAVIDSGLRPGDPVVTHGASALLGELDGPGSAEEEE